jgi:hypothetical protein
MTEMNRERYGLIILGNSGVGKSFLANLFLRTEQFVHKNAPHAVTTTTEFSEIEIGGTLFLIFNIPGLIEADQNQIERNKKEIDKAFVECPNSIVFYVFGHENGHIRAEDIIAFQALNQSYAFELDSLAFIINSVPSEREVSWVGVTIMLLEEMLKMKVRSNICFLDHVNTSNDAAKQDLRGKLLAVMETKRPKAHTKKQDIHLQVDEMKFLKKELKDRLKLFEQHRAQYVRKSKAQMAQLKSQIKRLISKAPVIGFSVGGAKDVNNFRENIQNNYLPVITDLSYEGVFYDYFFDTGDQQQDNNKKSLFYPSYSIAFTRNPFEEEHMNEYYMTVGLNSNLNEETFKRSPMNLLFCIDKSGSMDSPFDRYHYDQRHSKR